MPVLTSNGPPQVTDLAQRLSDDIQSGRVARQTFGAKNAAFAWASGLPTILATLVTTAVVDGLTFTATRTRPSGTPVAAVAEGGAKPNAVTVSVDAQPLKKYAGLANFSTEQQLSTDGLVPALAHTLTTSALLAFDTDCMTELSTEAGVAAGGATWTAAILDGIAKVVASGGNPTIVVLAAADYASAVGAPGVGYALNPTDGIPTLFGLRIVLSASLASKTAYVVDPAACLATESADSPVAVLDPFSGLSTNAIRMAIEYFAGFVVANPGGVGKVTYTGTMTAETETETSGGGSAGAKRDAYALGA